MQIKIKKQILPPDSTAKLQQNIIWSVSVSNNTWGQPFCEWNQVVLRKQLINSLGICDIKKAESNSTNLILQSTGTIKISGL